MSAPKKDDWVHVEFDACVVSDVGSAVELRVDGGALGGLLWVRPGVCTVIVPPVKVGDVVTEANESQLRVGAIVCRPGCGFACQLTRKGWQLVGMEETTSSPARHGDAVILHLGWGDAP